MADTTYIYSVFADDQGLPLNNREEHNFIRENMKHYADRQEDIQWISNPFTGSNSLVLDLDQISPQLHVFHFAGHAGEKRIDLEDQQFDASRLLQYLEPANSPELKVAFLNACNTLSIAKQLVASGVPVVLATEGKVSDREAIEVSKQFFTLLFTLKGKSISYILGRLKLRIDEVQQAKENSFASATGDGFDLGDGQSHVSKWHILYHPQKAALLDHWVPFPLSQGQHDLARSLVAEHPKEREKWLLEGLQMFNFYEQRLPINRHFIRYPAGGFFVHGEIQEGIAWISEMLLEKYKGMASFEEIAPLRCEEGLLEGTEAFADEFLKNALNNDPASLDRTDPASQNLEQKIDRIAEALLKRLAHTSLVAKIYEHPRVEVLKSMSDEILDEFWIPLMEKIHTRLSEIELHEPENYPMNKLLVLFIDENRLEATTLTELFPGAEELEVSKTIQKIPGIRESQPQDLEKWKRYLESDNSQHHFWTPLLNNWQELVQEKEPILILECACDCLQYDFSYKRREGKYLIRPKN